MCVWPTRRCVKRMKLHVCVCVHARFHTYHMLVLQMHDSKKVRVRLMSSCVIFVCMYKYEMWIHYVCVCVCVHVCARGLGQWASPLRHPSDPPHPPSCDGLSWMLMSCDGFGANKCFWHSTDSHYRTRPNGLASALMSRQISQPQPLYQFHTLLMQWRTSTPLTRRGEKLTLPSGVWKPP